MYGHSDFKQNFLFNAQVSVLKYLHFINTLYEIRNIPSKNREFKNKNNFVPYPTASVWMVCVDKSIQLFKNLVGKLCELGDKATEYYFILIVVTLSSCFC